MKEFFLQIGFHQLRLPLQLITHVPHSTDADCMHVAGRVERLVHVTLTVVLRSSDGTRSNMLTGANDSVLMSRLVDCSGAAAQRTTCTMHNWRYGDKAGNYCFECNTDVENSVNNLIKQSANISVVDDSWTRHLRRTTPFFPTDAVNFPLHSVMLVTDLGVCIGLLQLVRTRSTRTVDNTVFMSAGNPETETRAVCRSIRR
jgi:hypothetical protein